MSEGDMRALIEKLEKALGKSWADIVSWLQDQNGLPAIEERLAAGDTTGIVQQVKEAAERFAADIHAGYVSAGQDTASWLDGLVDSPVRFNATNDTAAAWAKENSADLVQGLSAETRDTMREVISAGVRDGLNPREIARDIQASIGLTANQAEAVASYRTALEAGDFTNALGRELSDGRLDVAIRTAQRTGAAIPADKIEAMVGKYAKNQVAWRATTIARTEALRAVHAGSAEAMGQAVKNGDLDADDLERQWLCAHDGRTRPSHRAMDKQKRALDEPFVTGDGVELDYPGDGPPDECCNCRCTVATRYVG